MGGASPTGAARPPLTIALLAIVALAVGAGCSESTGEEDPEPPATVSTLRPVEAFAPLVHLYRKEPARPIGAMEFISWSSLTMANDPCHSQETVAIAAPRLRLKRDEPAPVLRPARLGDSSRPHRQRVRGPGCTGHREAYATTQHTRPYDPGRAASLRPHEGFYLDLLTARLFGTAEYRRDGEQLTVDAPVYYDRRLERVDGRSALRIDYWLLFGLNGYPGETDAAYALDHEGDWERISVLLRRGDRPDSWKPLSVRFHVHGTSRDVPWADAQVASVGGEVASHPVVYAARGNHAPYPDAGRTVAVHRPPGEHALRAPDQRLACADCPVWSTWRSLRSVRREPWYGYGGAWGAVGSATGSSPIGPSPYTD